MFLSVNHKPLMMESFNHIVINKDTGQEIPRVIWANDETGRYRQYLVDEKGNLIFSAFNKLKSNIFKGNIELRKINH